MKAIDIILSGNTPVFKPGMRAESSEKENTTGFSPWKFIIIGGGGQAKETIDLIEENLEGKILGYVDRKNNGKLVGYPYLGNDSELDSIIKKQNPSHFFVAIGDLNTRTKLYTSVKKKLKPVSIISKGAHISKHSRIGEHVIIYPGAVISADVTIGDNVYINTNTTIAHEVIIGSNININPGSQIAGKVRVGDFSILGIGSSIKENLTVAHHTILGAGAVLVKNTIKNNTYVGVPAKLINARVRNK